MELNDGELQLFDRKRVHLTLPEAACNLRFLAHTLIEWEAEAAPQEAWEDRAMIELAEMSQPLFFGQVVDVEARRYLEKLSSTLSLKSGLDAFFQLRRFREFRLGLLMVHQKGEPAAWQIGAGAAPEDNTRALELERFNAFYSSVKKSKQGQHSTQQAKNQWLPFGGTFLAHTFSFRRFNAAWVVTREEFLPFSADEVREFQAFAQLLGQRLERLVELEFSDLRLAETMWVLERCPLPIILQDAQGMAVFTNAMAASSPVSEMSWLPLGRGFELGVGQLADWDNSQIDVLHRHKIALLGDLFNTLRHELSNPLFGLGLACDLLLTVESPADAETMLKEIKKNIQRSQQIISNLSKLYSEEDVAATCDVSQVLGEAVTLAKSELKAVRKRQTPQQVETGLTVEGRPLLVVQILFNLLVNSAQAMRLSTRPAEIQLTVRHDAEWVEIELADNGPGLPSSIRENLFRPFHTTKTQGHGLGLALSRDLALKVGGDLVYLDPPEGAAFLLKLKRVP